MNGRIMGEMRPGRAGTFGGPLPYHEVMPSQRIDRPTRMLLAALLLTIVVANVPYLGLLLYPF